MNVLEAPSAVVSGGVVHVSELFEMSPYNTSLQRCFSYHVMHPTFDWTFLYLFIAARSEVGYGCNQRCSVCLLLVRAV